MFEDYAYAEITLEELADIHPSKYVLCDIRDEVSHQYGAIPNSIQMSDICEQAQSGTLDSGTSYILYCMRGTQSLDAAGQLRSLGYDAVSLKGGYASWLTASFQEDESGNAKKQADVEQSIRKKFHKKLFTPFAKGINQYDMVQEGDKIAV